MLPTSHLGVWKGPNRLWFEDPVVPERSDATLAIEASTVSYRWSYRGKPQQGKIQLSGPPGAACAQWQDSWHAEHGMVMHGSMHEGVVSLYGTYAVADGPSWGWRIELDLRDPEHFVIRMFNLDPNGSIVPAVELRAAR